MAKMTYAEQLKHPNWQKRRLEALEAAGWTCQKCLDKETTLHVHHKAYIRGRMAWEYSLAELAVLCEPCHADEHGEQDRLREVLSLIPADSTRFATAIIAGYFNAGLDMDCDPAFIEEVRQAHPQAYELGVCAHVLGSRDFLWIKVIRDFAKSHPTTPVVRNLIAMWDDIGV